MNIYLCLSVYSEAYAYIMRINIYLRLSVYSETYAYIVRMDILFIYICLLTVKYMRI